MSFDANTSTAASSFLDTRAPQRRSQPAQKSQADKGFDQHLTEKSNTAGKRDEARKTDAPVQAKRKQPAEEPATPADAAARDEKKLDDTATSAKTDGTEPVNAAAVAEAPTTNALKQDIALAAEDEVIEIIAPEALPKGEAGLPGEEKPSDTKDLSAKPETTEDAGLNEALTALKNLVGQKETNPTASTEAAPADADEAANTAAKAVADAAAQQANGSQATDKSAENSLSLDGSKGRSIAQKLLEEARALKETGASATAISRTQEVAQSENAVGNRALAALEKTTAELTKMSNSAENGKKMLADVKNAADGPLLTLDELAEEAASETAERSIETKPKAEAKPAEGGARAAEAPAPAKGAPAAQPASAAAPELVLTQKVTDTQGLTSTSAKPELAHLPQQSSQAVPVQTVGIHVARQAMRGQTQFDIRLDPPELGRIEVKLEIGDDGKMRAHMVAEKAETLDLLQRDQRQLERTMQQNGMKGFDGGLSFSLKDQGQNNGQNSQGFAGQGEGEQAPWGDNPAEAANDPAPARFRQVRFGGVDMNV